jgi:hypothetical protein
MVFIEDLQSFWMKHSVYGYILLTCTDLGSQSEGWQYQVRKVPDELHSFWVDPWLATESLGIIIVKSPFCRNKVIKAMESMV